MPPFEGFDFSTFWVESAYAEREYVDQPPTLASIAAVQSRLGVTLPASYLALAAIQNGGIPQRTAHRTTEPTSWATDHVAISGIYSIGSSKPSSLCGQKGSFFWVKEWGYPDIGVYFADCPSAGHDMLCLDYRTCGPTGEPQVVHVDQELAYKITSVARDFETFIKGLQSEESFEVG